MIMGTHGIEMMKKFRFNRNLQRKNRVKLEQKLNDLSMNNSSNRKVFNKDLGKNRAAVLENQRRVAQEIEDLQWENKVKTLVSLAFTAAILLFWLERCVH